MKISELLQTPLAEFSAKIFSKKSKTHLDAFASHLRKGQLAVDVFQTEDDIVILAPIAGVKVEEIELILNEDVLTIRGVRELDVDIPQNNYYVQECFWGEFYRSIILPTAVNTSQIEASFQDGILKIRIPKANKVKMKIIKIKRS